MRRIGMRRASVAAIGLTLALVLMVVTAAAEKQTSVAERPTTPSAAEGTFGRAERGSREFPTPDAPTLDVGPSTDSGGVYIKGVGTVSHALIDDYFDRVQARMRDIRKGISPHDETSRKPLPDGEPNPPG
jgi:hypothetical protein